MFSEVHLRSNSSSTSGIHHDPFITCAGKHVWCFFTLLWTVCGIPAYIAMLCELYKTHRHGTPITPNTFFMLNLTVMDMVFLVFIPPGILNSYFMQSLAFENVWNSVYSLSVCGRPLLMACICLDCYLAVVHPLIYRQWRSLTPRILLMFIIWASTITSGILYFHNFLLFFTIFAIVPYLVAIVITIVCDSFILYTLYKSGPGGKNMHPQKQRAIQTLVNSLVIAVISYIPPVLLFVIGKSLVSGWAAYFCSIGITMTITSTMGSAVMPLLYLNSLGKFNCFRFKS